MEGMSGDLFATKGIEYLLVITYLILLVAGWRLVFPRRVKGVPHDNHHVLPAGYLFHQGHTWALIEEQRRVRVGIDDFAQHAIGHAVRFVLPPIGTDVVQGAPAMGARLANGETIPILSPVSGVVIGVNTDVVQSPGIVNTRPYHDGWFMEVRVNDTAAVRRNLLSGELAECWFERARGVPDADALDELMMLRADSWAVQEV